VPPKPARPEVTSPLQTYIELHRHAAVRAALLGHPGVALRLMVAHAIAGSGLWRVSPEPQETRNEAVAASLAASASEAAFAAGRRAALAPLGATDDRHSITDGYAAGPDAGTVFARLLDLSDDDVMRILIVVMGETLQAGSAAVEAAGVHLGLDMAAVWQADDAFFRPDPRPAGGQRHAGEVGGQSCADANVAETVKTQKRVIRDCLAGTNGRTKVEAWLPGWMAFPVRSYTDRGGGLPHRRSLGATASAVRVGVARGAGDGTGPSPAGSRLIPESPRARARGSFRIRSLSLPGGQELSSLSRRRASLTRSPWFDQADLGRTLWSPLSSSSGPQPTRLG